MKKRFVFIIAVLIVAFLTMGTYQPPVELPTAIFENAHNAGYWIGQPKTLVEIGDMLISKDIGTIVSAWELSSWNFKTISWSGAVWVGDTTYSVKVGDLVMVYNTLLPQTLTLPWRSLPNNFSINTRVGTLHTTGNVGVGTSLTHVSAALDLDRDNIILPLGDRSILLGYDGGDCYLETRSTDMSEGMLMQGNGSGDSGVIRQIASNGYANGWAAGLHIFHNLNEPIIFTTNSQERARIAGTGEFHWMDGGYVSAYFNIDNPSSPYTGDPSLAGIFLDSGNDRSCLFGVTHYFTGTVGVGTTNLDGDFHIKSPDSGTVSLILEPNGITGDAVLSLYNGDGGLGTEGMIWTDVSEQEFIINAIGDGHNNDLVFQTQDNDRLVIKSTGELHWMDTGYVSAYFNIDNPSSPYTGDPSLAGIFLDSGNDRTVLFGSEVQTISNFKIGNASAGADYQLRFDGETNDGSITYMEDEDRFDFDNDVRIPGKLTVVGGIDPTYLSFTEQVSNPWTPVAGYHTIWARNDGVLVHVTDTGAEYEVAGPGATVEMTPALPDIDSSNVLNLKYGDNATSDYDLTFFVSGASRQLTVSGNSSINQSLLTTSAPTFNGGTFNSFITVSETGNQVLSTDPAAFSIGADVFNYYASGDIGGTTLWSVDDAGKMSIRGNALFNMNMGGADKVIQYNTTQNAFVFNDSLQIPADDSYYLDSDLDKGMKWNSSSGRIEFFGGGNDFSFDLGVRAENFVATSGGYSLGIDEYIYFNAPTNTKSLRYTGTSFVFSDSLTIGVGAAGVDYVLGFDGETSDGNITYMEDEDAWNFSGTGVQSTRFYVDGSYSEYMSWNSGGIGSITFSDDVSIDGTTLDFTTDNTASFVGRESSGTIFSFRAQNAVGPLAFHSYWTESAGAGYLMGLYGSGNLEIAGDMVVAGNDLQLNTGETLSWVTDHFTLSDDLDLLGNTLNNVLTFTSNAVNPASGGAIQLGNTEIIAWRNQANGGDVFFYVNTSDQFQFSSDILANNGIIHSGNASTDGHLYLHDGSSNSGDLVTASLSANRTWTFPDADGTVSLSSDVLWLKSGTTIYPKTAGDDLGLPGGDNINFNYGGTAETLSFSTGSGQFVLTDDLFLNSADAYVNIGATADNGFSGSVQTVRDFDSASEWQPGFNVYSRINSDPGTDIWVGYIGGTQTNADVTGKIYGVDQTVQVDVGDTVTGDIYAVRGVVLGAGTFATKYGGYFTAGGAINTGPTYGVYAGASGNAVNNYGIYATASGGTNNYAGYFSGQLYSTSTITSLSGSLVLGNTSETLSWSTDKFSFSDDLELVNGNLYLDDTTGIFMNSANTSTFTFASDAFQCNGPDDAAEFWVKEGANAPHFWVRDSVANVLTLGAGLADLDYQLVFNGETNDGSITYMEDEDRFDFDNDVRIPGKLTVGGNLEVAGTSTYYGEMYQVDNANVTAITVSNQWEEVNNYSTGEVNGVSVANSDMTVTNAGKYRVTVTISSIAEAANTNFEFAVSVDDVIQTKTKIERRFSSTDVGAIALSGILNLSANAVLKLETRNITVPASTTDVTIQDSNFSITKL